VLVGTKLDLRNDPSTLDQLAEKNQRPITQSQGEYLARMCSAKAYIECSSMLNFNIRNVFEQAIEIHNSYEQRYRHGLNGGRRILSDKFHSCSWFGSLLCCTNGSKTSSSSKKSSRTKKTNQNRYTM
jgi:GTPase SAR1 family protein